MAGTGATCLAAASRIPGSIAQRMLPADARSENGPADATPPNLRIGHPMGVMDVLVSIDSASEGTEIRYATLGFVRTARRLMAGTAYLPADSL